LAGNAPVGGLRRPGREVSRGSKYESGVLIPSANLRQCKPRSDRNPICSRARSWGWTSQSALAWIAAWQRMFSIRVSARAGLEQCVRLVPVGWLKSGCWWIASFCIGKTQLCYS